MSLALYEYPVEPSTDEAVLGRRDLYYNAFPQVEYELEIDPHAMERIRPEWFTAHGSVTRQAEPVVATAIEEQVARQLTHTVTEWVDRHVLSPMRGFEDVSRRATRELAQLRDGLVQMIVARGNQRRWLDTGTGFERIECRAEVNPRLLAHGAMQWNLRQPHHRERYEAWRGDGWRRGRDQWRDTPWYAQEPRTWQEATPWHYPQMVNQWVDYGTGGWGGAGAYTAVEIQATNADAIDFNFINGTSAATYYNVQMNVTMTTNMTTGASYVGVDVADTPERRLARQRADELAKRRAAKRAREREAAEKRGRKLLLSLLDEEQTREYARTSTFKVTAADGRVFRLRKGKTAELLDTDVATASYCIHLFADTDGRRYVDEDTMISQMLLLQNDVEEFERIANITPLVYHRAPGGRRGRPPVLQRDAAQGITYREMVYREQHIRESEAILRAEGIENPREWVEGLQQAAVAEQGDVLDAILTNLEEIAAA